MKEEEINNLLYKYHNNYAVPILTSMDTKIERLREDIRKEHEDLLMRAVNAETQLKLYEAIFNKLNLNVSLDVGGKKMIDGQKKGENI